MTASYGIKRIPSGNPINNKNITQEISLLKATQANGVIFQWPKWII
jgi:hypothetical protein